MSIYKPQKDRRKALEEVLKDLDPATRELAKAVLENILKEELAESEYEKLIERLRKFQRKELR